MLVLALEDVDWDTDRATLLLHRFQSACGPQLDALAKARYPHAFLTSRATGGPALASQTGNLDCVPPTLFLPPARAVHAT